MNLTLENKKIEAEYRQQEAETVEMRDNADYRQAMLDLGIEVI